MTGSEDRKAGTGPLDRRSLDGLIGDRPAFGARKVPVVRAPGCSNGLFTLFGIILPTVAVILEARFHLRTWHSDPYSSPVATWGHTIILLGVPLSFLLAECDLAGSPWNRQARLTGWAFLLNGYALAVSAWYTLAMGPQIPYMIMVIPIFGMGIMALTPFWCTVCGVCQMVHLYARRRTAPVRIWLALAATAAGGALALALLAVLVKPYPLLFENGPFSIVRFLPYLFF